MKNWSNKNSSLRRKIDKAFESFLWGGNKRESFLLNLLSRHYKSQFRREWQLSDEPPHYYNQRWGMFEFAFSDRCRGVHPFNRGFFGSELVESADILLDIGCGDGFFTRRFLAPVCLSVDAIDIEETAIAFAQQHNNAENITYAVLDAVSQPFPRERYTAIVWDGAMGHFAAETTQDMLARIAASLTENGIFWGSESLGREGSDHLQFFDNLEDLHALLQPHFQYIQLREVEYQIPKLTRREAYWRCTNDPDRLKKCAWQDFSTATVILSD